MVSLLIRVINNKPPCAARASCVSFVSPGSKRSVLSEGIPSRSSLSRFPVPACAVERKRSVSQYPIGDPVHPK
ncbi:hypothetical protein CCHR01_11423 [Colletotrichum chrysophilum]|uniref:Uncharacterized protein n=1 Tax=Colletotrichum chrysophilum TaxID=1836956 RepID=A0AAD9AD41_9PEZI|nr:hypothetical protein CCHR01_11423 [Colletotrichum chrysophilum]